MKKPFIFKHYWDEKSAETRVLPKWLNSADERLTYEQVKIKKIVEELLKPSKYIDYSQNKQTIGFDSIHGYKIYYKSEKNDDADPVNNREVTDIIFCISKKKIDIAKCSWIIDENNNIESYINKYYFKIIGIILIVFIFFFFFLSNKDKENKPNEVKVPDTVTKSLPVSEKKVMSGNHDLIGVTSLCANSFRNIIEKRDSDYCFEGYIKERCKKMITCSYNSWLSKKRSVKHYPICKLVNSLQLDGDFYTYLKKIENRKIEKKIKQFMQGK